MSAVVQGLAPIFLLVMAGYVIRRHRLLDEGFWVPAERLIYYFLFPAMLVSGLAKADLASLPVGPLAAALVGSVLFLTAALVAARHFIPVDGPVFTSLVQGSIRPNGYVAIATGAAVFQGPGLAVTALGIAVVVPLVNVISVIVLGRWGSHPGSASTRAILRQVGRNPLVWSCLAGVLINLVGGLPPIIRPLLEILAAAALPLGLLAVGAGLDLAAARAAGAVVVGTSALKLAVLPAITAAACWLLGVGGPTAAAAVIFNAMPCAPSAYVMARQMGGDHRLMAGILTFETMLAAVSLPAVILLVRV